MDFIELVNTRRSVRTYQEKEVPEEVLNQVLEAARLAPSASNMQPWKFVVVRDLQKRKDLSTAASEQHFLATAPVIVAAVSLEPEAVMPCDVPLYPVDVTIAVSHFSLAAAAAGLGTCWVGSFSQERVREILAVPEACKVVILMPLGYPDDEPRERVRKPLGELVCYESFA